MFKAAVLVITKMLEKEPKYHQKIMQINYTAYSNTTRKRQVTEKGVTLWLYLNQEKNQVQLER